jgi:cardiolipin synthase A/B
VDGVWSTVGSANFDNRSFQLNDETVLGVQDEAFAAELTRAFEHDLSRSAEMTLEDWRSRPALERVREVGVRLLRREL